MKHPVDVHVGKRVRHRRWMVGMTQQQLGDIVGIKFQQIQKYETGMNRISASRLWDIAQALDVSVSFFFEGFDGELPETAGAAVSRRALDGGLHRAQGAGRAPRRAARDLHGTPAGYRRGMAPHRRVARTDRAGVPSPGGGGSLGRPGGRPSPFWLRRRR